MLNRDLSIAEPLLHEVISHRVCCSQRLAKLLSWLLGLSVSGLWLCCHTGCDQRLAVKEAVSSLAYLHTTSQVTLDSRHYRGWTFSKPAISLRQALQLRSAQQSLHTVRSSNSTDGKVLARRDVAVRAMPWERQPRPEEDYAEAAAAAAEAAVAASAAVSRASAAAVAAAKELPTEAEVTAVHSMALKATSAAKLAEQAAARAPLGAAGAAAKAETLAASGAAAAAESVAYDAIKYPDWQRWALLLKVAAAEESVAAAAAKAAEAAADAATKTAPDSAAAAAANLDTVAAARAASLAKGEAAAASRSLGPWTPFRRALEMNPGKASIVVAIIVFGFLLKATFAAIFATIVLAVVVVRIFGW
eukprot:gnl/TRDRNA2_/TRDRNA2_53024_c0_seq1.p1 gnl/TRDRNA2_/TRDRNA2_53024_c0~~gnl/TRDRNA2_/TRDRNA2_53024_c0_seq1.p1  ORF type:complete len:361 (-),score=73.47 gnl/TRDRNA2_/TRDRNA2_53024_c0_seq1:158-1240(-)